MSSLQWFSTRGSSALWRYMEMCGGIFLSLLRNLVGPGQGCWTACKEQDRPAQWGTIWPKMPIVPSLKTLQALGGRGWGLSCSQIWSQHLAQGLAQRGSSINSWSERMHAWTQYSVAPAQRTQVLATSTLWKPGCSLIGQKQTKNLKKKYPPCPQVKFSLDVEERFCSLSPKSYWFLSPLPFRNLSGVEEYSHSKKKKIIYAETLRNHQATKALHTLIPTNDSDHDWPRPGKIC